VNSILLANPAGGLDPKGMDQVGEEKNRHNSSIGEQSCFVGEEENATDVAAASPPLALF